jgi:hypothetical protein
MNDCNKRVSDFNRGLGAQRAFAVTVEEADRSRSDRYSISAASKTQRCRIS